MRITFFARGEDARAMPGGSLLVSEPPSSDDIRAELERVVGSDDFRLSPRLVAFLRYIVETTLNGQAARIKAFTIGTDALGRPPGFDSQRDPIVRVEALRLRRALSTYYEGAGAEDPIVIEVPRGGYVPVFRRRAVRGREDIPPVVPRRVSRVMVTATTVLAILAGLMAIATFRGGPILAPAATGFPLVPADAPVLLVEPVKAAPGPAAMLAGQLTRELTGVLRRVQPILLVSAAPTAAKDGRGGSLSAARGYRLSGSIDAPEDGPWHVTLRLAADGAIAWTRDWHIDRGEPSVVMIARDAATDIAASSSIMRSQLRAQSDQLSPGYRCLMAAADYIRKFELAQHERIRDCLERTAAQNPKFETVFAVLSFVYEREYLHDLPSGSHEVPALERSLGAARRALELNPDSAIAYLAVMENMYLRGDLPAAYAAGEKALSLNPLDPTVSGAFGLRLALSGQTERGTALLKQAASLYGNNPVWLDFGLFCLAYLKGDMSAAAKHADIDPNSTFPYGLVSRALAAAAAGDHERARQILSRLTSLYPGWSEPNTMLARFIRSPELTDRLAHDLAAIARP